MRIGINARYVQRGYHSGIEKYTFELIRNLSRIDRINEYVLFFLGDRPLPPMELGDNFKISVTPVRFSNQVVRVLWDLFILPVEIKRRKIDVFHAPFFSPIIKVSTYVISVHDLAYIYFPEFYTKAQLALLRTILPINLRCADAIIAPSENTKNDVLRIFGIPSEKVHVIYEAADEIFGRTDKINEVENIRSIRSKYGVTRDYVLTVGVISPRKNYTSLLRAFRKIVEETQHYQLVIVGGVGWKHDEFFRTLRESDLWKHVVITGYVPSDDLVYLYSGATLFVFPSFYEGFGIPLVEAMACGCPIAASNSSCIPEICGDAAVYFDPCSVDDMYVKMRNLLRDRELREKLSSRALARARQFSWLKTAERTVEVYSNYIRRK